MTHGDQAKGDFPVGGNREASGPAGRLAAYLADLAWRPWMTTIT